VEQKEAFLEITFTDNKNKGRLIWWEFRDSFHSFSPFQYLLCSYCWKEIWSYTSRARP